MYSSQMKVSHKKKILIVDDAKESLNLLTILLQANNYSVESTTNGKEALMMLNKSEYLPDLIILDTQMPVMDGFEFRLLQSQSPRISKIPVLVTTGDTDSSISKRMMYPMKIEHKPLQITPLLESITQCLSGEQPSSIQL
jgi:CheY-like chemotaxis protein